MCAFAFVNKAKEEQGEGAEEEEKKMRTRNT